MGLLKGPRHLSQPGVSCQSCFPHAWLTTQIGAVKVAAHLITAGESHQAFVSILGETCHHEDFLWGDQHLTLFRKDRQVLDGDPKASPYREEGGITKSVGHCLIQGTGGKLAQADRVPHTLGYKVDPAHSMEHLLSKFPAAAPTTPQQLQGPGQVEMQGLEREVVHVGLPGATASPHSLIQLPVQSDG